MNQKGAGLIGLLLTVAIIGIMAYGSYVFWNKDEKTDNNQNPVQLHNIKVKAQQDIENINKTIASSSNNYLE